MSIIRQCVSSMASWKCGKWLNWILGKNFLNNSDLSRTDFYRIPLITLCLSPSFSLVLLMYSSDFPCNLSSLVCDPKEIHFLYWCQVVYFLALSTTVIFALSTKWHPFVFLLFCLTLFLMSNWSWLDVTVVSFSYCHMVVLNYCVDSCLLSFGLSGRSYLQQR